MAIFKCKMCGGDLEINQEKTVCECQYCGRKQTLPRMNDERKTNLYNRANHFRRNNEYDKAMSIYEQILNEDLEDAESYWSLVLCRYGIEYVEDPITKRRVPTVNRTQHTSIYSDADYQAAIKYADVSQRMLYEEEAKEIEQIQRGILAISGKEEPFDVFICYKESDEYGKRTPDSVLATELYYELTEEGFKVFFSRITLEDKLGSAFEPYIFAALNSARVMIVLGTKPEYFNAVWVKNEWGRYLAMIRGGAKKVLIPAYRDMDPYDLPDELSYLQAQDMSKLGFMQDLNRGIKKILSEDSDDALAKEIILTKEGGNVAPLLKRAFLYLEDGNWKSADEYCERVLDMDPEYAEAYLGKLMARFRVRTRQELVDVEEAFDADDNYRKVMRFGDEKLQKEIIAYTENAYLKREEKRRLNEYEQIVAELYQAETDLELREVVKKFEELGDYRDAQERIKECYERAEIFKKQEYVTEAMRMMEKGRLSDYEAAMGVLANVLTWEGAQEQIRICKSKIQEKKEKMEEERLRLLEVARVEKQNEREQLKRVVIFCLFTLGVIIATSIWIFISI